MIFLTGNTGEGKTYAIQEFIQTESVPIYIIDDDFGYENMPQQSNIEKHTTQDWGEELIKKIKKHDFVIVIADGGDNIKNVVYDIKQKIEPYMRKECVFIATIDDNYLIQQDDTHFRLYHNYQNHRKAGMIDNPLITNDVANLFFFQLPVNDKGQKEQLYQNMDYLVSAYDMSLNWGVTSGHIKNLCAKGDIICKKVSRTWIIDKRQKNPAYLKQK